jgi:hypothetical protein
MSASAKKPDEMKVKGQEEFGSYELHAWDRKEHREFSKEIISGLDVKDSNGGSRSGQGRGKYHERKMDWLWKEISYAR